jgi:hypothetical protein
LRRVASLLAAAVEPVGEVLLGAFEEVAVNAESHRRVGVAQALSDGEDVGAVVDEEAGVRVPEVIRPEVFWETGLAERRPYDPCPESVSVEGLAVLVEDEVVVRADRPWSVDEVSGESFAEPVGKGNRAVAGVRLGRSVEVLSGPAVVRPDRGVGRPGVEDSALEIEVGYFCAAEFSGA